MEEEKRLVIFVEKLRQYLCQGISCNDLPALSAIADDFAEYVASLQFVTTCEAKARLEASDSGLKAYDEAFKVLTVVRDIKPLERRTSIKKIRIE